MTKKLIVKIEDGSVDEIIDVLEIIKHQLSNGFQQGFDSTFKNE